MPLSNQLMFFLGLWFCGTAASVQVALAGQVALTESASQTCVCSRLGVCREMAELGPPPVIRDGAGEAPVTSQAVRLWCAGFRGHAMVSSRSQGWPSLWAGPHTASYCRLAGRIRVVSCTGACRVISGTERTTLEGADPL